MSATRKEKKKQEARWNYALVRNSDPALHNAIVGFAGTLDLTMDEAMVRASIEDFAMRIAAKLIERRQS